MKLDAFPSEQTKALFPTTAVSFDRSFENALLLNTGSGNPTHLKARAHLALAHGYKHYWDLHRFGELTGLPKILLAEQLAAVEVEQKGRTVVSNIIARFDAHRTEDLRRMSLNHARIARSQFPRERFETYAVGSDGNRVVTKTQTVGGIAATIRNQLSIPPLSYDTITTRIPGLKSITGRKPATLLYFWSTQCSPCLQAIPRINELSLELDADNAAIIGLNVDNNAESYEVFLSKNRVDFSEFRIGTPHALTNLLGIDRYPFTLVLTGCGELAAVGHSFSSKFIKRVLRKLEGLP